MKLATESVNAAPRHPSSPSEIVTSPNNHTLAIVTLHGVQDGRNAKSGGEYAASGSQTNSLTKNTDVRTT